MPRKALAKKSQPTASKKEASNVNASSKNRPAKPKRSAPASKSKSSGNSIDALVKKQLTSLRQEDTLFTEWTSNLRGSCGIRVLSACYRLACMNFRLILIFDELRRSLPPCPSEIAESLVRRVSSPRRPLSLIEGPNNCKPMRRTTSTLLTVH